MREEAGGAARDTLTATERALAEDVARALVERRLGGAAALMLEGMVPMNFVASQVMAFFSPLIKIVRDQSKIDQFQEMLEKREAIPYILKAIHQLEEARRG